MAKELVTVAKYNDVMLATMARQVLTDAGIKAFTVGETVADMFPGAAPIELKVENDMVEEALAILDAFNEAQTLTDKDLEEDFEQES
jgi:hypothetical protein